LILHANTLLKKLDRFPFLPSPPIEWRSRPLLYPEVLRLFLDAVRFFNLLFLSELIRLDWAYLELTRILTPDPCLLRDGTNLAVQEFLLRHFPSRLFRNREERQRAQALFTQAGTFVRPVYSTLSSQDLDLVTPEFLAALDAYIGFHLEELGIRLKTAGTDPELWDSGALLAAPDHPQLYHPARDLYLDLFPFLVFADGRTLAWFGRGHPAAFAAETGRIVLSESAETRRQLLRYFDLFLLPEAASDLVSGPESALRRQALEALGKIKAFWDNQALLPADEEITEYQFLLYRLNGGRPGPPHLLLDFMSGLAQLARDKPEAAILAFRKLIRRAPSFFHPYPVLADLLEQKGHAGEARQCRETLADILLPAEPATPEPAAPEIRSPGRSIRPEPRPAPPELTDLTAALATSAPTVLGRDREAASALEILCCMNRNNVLVVGDPGVGKTVLVREIVRRLLREDVPVPLQAVSVYELNVGATFGDSRHPGQVEEKLNRLLALVESEHAILFIDDIHAVLAGGAARSGGADLAMLLKPYLEARKIRVVAAATFEGYAKHLESLPLFTRLFQKIELEELPLGQVAVILKLKSHEFSHYHRVTVDIDRICQHLELVKQFFRDRLLPDKAIELLDRTCARIGMSAAASAPPGQVGELDFLRTVADSRGVELSTISVSLQDKLRHLEEMLGSRIVGQADVLRKIARKIVPARTGLKINPNRPDAVFLFIGPTGVGKTETARILAEVLYGSPKKLLRIDMSEYMEEYSVSRLIGAAPGYVGYDDPNQLIDEIRRDPYRVVLLDEIEKAHPLLVNIFLQVFDSGVLTDGRGRKAYFDKTVFIMTSNVGTALFSEVAVGFRSAGAGKVTRTAHQKEVKRFFKPEFLNRIDEIVFFRSLSFEDARRIVQLNIERLAEPGRENGLQIHISRSGLDFLTRRGYSEEYGAREVLRVIQDEVLQKIAEFRLRTGRMEREFRCVYRKKEDRLVFQPWGSPKMPVG
jgi:ATP-dependent Clp protease ATP-binding subunit ClpA